MGFVDGENVFCLRRNVLQVRCTIVRYCLSRTDQTGLVNVWFSGFMDTPADW